MAIVRAVKSGNWSDPTTWNTGALPTSADNVYSNTFTVTIDVSPTVLSISNAAATGVTAGGVFELSNGVSITCTAPLGITGSGTAANVIRLSTAGSATINSNLGPGACISNTSTGTLTLNGNYTGGQLCNFSVPPFGVITNLSSGTLNLNGYYSLIITSNNLGAISNNGAGTLNLAGTIEVNSASTQSYNTANLTNLPLSNRSSGVINVTGNVISNGVTRVINNTSVGTVNITSNISTTAQTGDYLLENSSSGTMEIIGSLTAGTTWSIVSPGSATQNTLCSGPLVCSDPNNISSGVMPVVARRWFIKPSNIVNFYLRIKSATVSNNVRANVDLFTTDSYSSGYPSASNVRSSTTYGPGSIYTGTCAVPPAGSVALGVPVDNTTGTAYITANDIATALSSASAVTLNQQTSSLTTPGSIGERLKLASTVATTAQQLSDALSD